MPTVQFFLYRTSERYRNIVDSLCIGIFVFWIAYRLYYLFNMIPATNESDFKPTSRNLYFVELKPINSYVKTFFLSDRDVLFSVQIRAEPAAEGRVGQPLLHRHSSRRPD
jgi:hypothetical protein